MTGQQSQINKQINKNRIVLKAMQCSDRLIELEGEQWSPNRHRSCQEGSQMMTFSQCVELPE